MENIKYRVFLEDEWLDLISLVILGSFFLVLEIVGVLIPSGRSRTLPSRFFLANILRSERICLLYNISAAIFPLQDEWSSDTQAALYSSACMVFMSH